jgi:hypothetical protein
MLTNPEFRVNLRRSAADSITVRIEPPRAAAGEFGQELDAASLKSLAMDSWFSIFAGGALMEVNDLGSLAVGQRLRRELDL